MKKYIFRHRKSPQKTGFKRKRTVAYIITLIIVLFVAKGGYDFNRVTKNLELDEELKTKTVESFKNGRYDESIRYAQEALSLNMKTMWKDYGDNPKDFYNLSVAWEAKGEIDKAIEYINKSIESAKKKYGELDDFTKKAEETLSAFEKLKTF